MWDALAENISSQSSFHRAQLRNAEEGGSILNINFSARQRFRVLHYYAWLLYISICVCACERACILCTTITNTATQYCCCCCCCCCLLPLPLYRYKWLQINLNSVETNEDKLRWCILQLRCNRRWRTDGRRKVMRRNGRDETR